MLAVIKTGGKQYLVQAGQALAVEKLVAEPGSSVQFEEVLLVSEPDGSGFQLGKPQVKTKVSAKVEAQTRDRKIRVIKYKRKVRYKKVYGHRQHKTKVTIDKIA